MIANLITCSRILFAFGMLFSPVFSSGFYIFYLAAGFSDMIDGTVARRLGTESALGSKLDTAADIVFVLAAAIKLLPKLSLPIPIWIWVGVITLIKICNILYGLMRKKQFVSVHSILNKATGVLLFLLPFTWAGSFFAPSVLIVCTAATIAAIDEGVRIRKYETS